MVKQILAISKQQEEGLKPIRITPIVKEVLSFLRASLPATIEIRSHFQADTDSVKADPTQIHQVLMNLCTNAGQAMKPGGGVLDVLVETVGLDQQEMVQGTIVAAGEYLHMAVSDTGCGIPEECIEKIFDPYFSTKDKEHNSGLGLAVVHGIVSSHSGGIQVRSSVGKGTTFHIYLPLQEPETVAKDRGVDEVPHGNERILFVDDAESIVAVNRQVLSRLGYQVTGETKAVDAISVFRQNPDAFDLLICDKTMARLTGFDVVGEIRKQRSDLPVILCTGFSEQEDLRKCDDLGIDAFIIKPIHYHDFARIIRDVLDRRKVAMPHR